MLSNRIPLLAAMALTCLVPLLTPSARGMEAPPMPPAQAVGGDLLGLWNLPVPGAPGRAAGRLVGPNGPTPLSIDALVLPQPGNPGRGAIVGRLVAEAGGPHQAEKVVAAVRGQWRRQGPGHGVFRLTFLVPDEAQESGYRPIGFARGQWVDPTPQMPNPNGAFRGKFVLAFGSGMPAAQ